MISFLISGIILGFSAGVAPGPLLGLMISETLRHNLHAGVKIAIVPIITDVPIVLLALLVLAKLAHSHVMLGAISIFGGLFISYLGYQNLQIKGIDIRFEDAKGDPLKKGIIANFLNPHPYLFWISVGAPMTVKAMNQNMLTAAIFIGSFYIFLVGSKLVIALIVARSRSFLSGSTYIYIMRALGGILLVLAVLLFYDGIKLLI